MRYSAQVIISLNFRNISVTLYGYFTKTIHHKITNLFAI